MSCAFADSLVQERDEGKEAVSAKQSALDDLKCAYGVYFFIRYRTRDSFAMIHSSG